MAAPPPVIVVDDQLGEPDPHGRRFSTADIMDEEEAAHCLMVARSRAQGRGKRRMSMTVWKCDRCGEEINPAIHEKKHSDDGLLHWHAWCYTCKTCSVNLEETGFFVQVNEIYCPKCMDETFGETCGRCHEKIYQYSKEEEMLTCNTGDKYFHKSCVPVSKSPQTSKKHLKTGKQTGRRRSLCNLTFN